MSRHSTTDGGPELSIVIPAYDEARRLPDTLAKIDAYLQDSALATEVLVVENGSTDRTREIAQAFAAEHPYLRVLHSAKGKGIAVQTGMLAARGAYRCMCDADFSMPIEEMPRLIEPLMQGSDVAIASREAPGARRYGEPRLRHWMGRVFNGFERVLVLPQFHDTQCGFKCFRGAAAEQIFARQTMTGWGFDLEIVVIALALNFRVVEVPINWYYDADSRISPVRHSVSMLRDLLEIRSKWKFGLYDGPQGSDVTRSPIADISQPLSGD